MISHKNMVKIIITLNQAGVMNLVENQYVIWLTISLQFLPNQVIVAMVLIVATKCAPFSKNHQVKLFLLQVPLNRIRSGVVIITAMIV